MNYRQNNLKDEEVISLVYLVKEILFYRFNKTSYEGIKDTELIDFIGDSDLANSSIEPISKTVVKDIFSLFNSDTRYRPKYNSLDFFSTGLLKREHEF